MKLLFFKGMSNYYGELFAYERDGKCFWGLQDYNGYYIGQIPESLFEELKRISHPADMHPDLLESMMRDIEDHHKRHELSIAKCEEVLS